MIRGGPALRPSGPNLRFVDFDSILRFVAVVDCGSFAAAARSLDITPQALSASIAKLEAALGLVLFDRERGGITTATELGAAFLPHARFIIAAERRAVEEVHAVRDARSGWVRLGIGEGMGGATIVRAIAELRREAPDSRVVLIESYTKVLLEKLDRGELDLIAGAPDSSRVRRPNLRQKFLYVAHDVMVVRRQHPLATLEHVSLEQMRHYTWMLPHARGDCYEAVVNTYTEHGLTPPQHVLHSDTATVGLELLATEDYILMVTPDLIWPRLGEEGTAFVVLNAPLPTIERHACLLYRSDQPLSAMAARLEDMIVSLVAQRGAKPARLRR